MIDLRGTGVALITPMKPDGKPDLPALRKLVEHVMQGVDYIVALGTTGESATLTTEEKASIVQVIVSVAAGKKPVVLGHGGNDTDKLIRQMREIHWTGIDAVLSVSPYYNKPGQQGILRHYQQFADVCPVPVILYNVPGRTGSNISAETTLQLAAHANIIGTKEASGNLEQAMLIARDKPSGFFLLSGDDLLTPSLISIGAEGVISVLANAWPREFSAMVQDCLNQDFGSASAYWKNWLELNPLLYEEGNPVGIKAVLEELELCSSAVRMPLMEASPDLKIRIRKALEGIMVG